MLSSGGVERECHKKIRHFTKQYQNMRVAMIRGHFLDVHANFGHCCNIEIYSLLIRSVKAFTFLEKVGIYDNL